ncbi:SusC/RagA family TonB-linked outer membrane protein [Elizabethkingia sp. HvH-WGS333]|uniref:SusC/RagA family TonB-linked outer membrane protein n=1 Tax=Elizabethkingia TaxID=308865 RepID=UPI000741577C|nr:MULTISPECIES: SusC/RagA family TonB-linked outer membrane protein [Elizabethkingia]KUG13430.1 membrane receptor RagA [Elizabethkingia miricola]MCL1655270.1 SusC/RagA family TonB-linked outer membrane protein [Elizabethkingia miricola]MDX8573636.1 SusC/RagA family TonB-linked outer membrane protein [Elizabethkingia sp. HX QKY]OIK44929.1 SusC/RagA family TonB-linked outer membrane protein [Elizabethkingia sp. HvH-WGS333]
MNKLNVKTPFTMAVVCFLFSTTCYVKAQKTKSDSSKTKEIQEVVVTALGIKREQRKLGYSITQVSSKDITDAGVVNPMAALQGKVPGVNITAGAGGPQSSSRILIRGNTSLGPNNQPLIVIDGIIMDNSTTGAGEWGEDYDFGNEMKNLNSESFESVSVLRGAAASSLYGSRAANGVIVITTKKGRKGAGIGVRISSSLTAEQVYAGPKFQNKYGGGLSPDFTKGADGINMLDPNTVFYSYGPAFDGSKVRDIDGRIIDWTAQPNNWKQLYQVGFNRNNLLELSGGTDKSTYIFSYNNNYAEGILPRNSFKKDAFYFRGTHEFNKYLQLDASINYTKTLSENPLPQGGGAAPLYWIAYYVPRNFDMNYWKDRYIDSVKGGALTGAADPYGMAEPLFNLYQNTRTQSENNYMGRMELKSRATDWLDIAFSANFNNIYLLRENKLRGTDPGFRGGSYETAEGRKEQLNFRFMANGRFKLMEGLDMSATAGAEEWRSKYKETIIRTKGGLKTPDIFEVTNSVDPIEVLFNYTDGYQSPKIIRSLYAFANFNFKDQLFVDITGRNDWSSTLAYSKLTGITGKTSFFYPSFTANWNFSQTFKLPRWWGYSSLRAALAWTGKDTSPFNTSAGLFYRNNRTYQLPEGGQISLPEFNSATLANLNLKNELTRSIEFGLNMSFLKSRLDLDVSYYKNNTTNQILSLPIPIESGVQSQQINAGNIQNEGIEITLNTTPIKTENFKWNSTINFSKNKDKIISLTPGVEEYILEWAFGRDIRSIAIPGSEYGLIQTKYGFARYQALDNNGNKIDDPKNGMKVLKPNGQYMRSDSYQNQSYVNVGKMAPDFLASFRNSFRYKNVSLNVLIDARVGGNIISATYNYASQLGALEHTLYGRTTETGGIAYTDSQGNKRVGIIPEGVFAQGTEITDLSGTKRNVGGMTYQEAYNNGWITPLRTDIYYRALGSWGTGIREQAVLKNTWIALRELSIGYDFPKTLIHQVGLQNLKVSLVGRNLFYIYNSLTDNINPESLYNNRSGSAVEYGGIPFTRYIGFHLDFTF